MNYSRSRLIFLLLTCVQLHSGAQSRLSAVPFDRVHIADRFWTPRLESHSTKTLETCITQTQDSTERINNFKKTAGEIKGKHVGIYFDDSDVYKAMEGIAYSLAQNPDPQKEALLDQWIDLVARSQQPDGYLNTYYTLNFPEKRLTDMEKHELYCGGHMIEAAVAHHQATGKTTFLNIAIKFADFLDNTFGPGKRHWVTGHEEIELALVKLYRETSEKRYLDLAHWFLEERGQGHGVGAIWDNKDWGPKYCQDDVPVAEISEIKGHAVRAMYLFSGMADVAAERGEPQYLPALERVWDDVVNRNMYITGGIGSSGHNEGFTEDYDLPNKEAYCETCASIGMVLWNSRMNLLTGDAKYADVLERCLYNGVLSGISLEGDRFFYVNPLESDGNHHRQRWFGCACCPSNLSRFLPSIGNYIYQTGPQEVVVNLYLGNEAAIDLSGNRIKLLQKTDYPWSGKTELQVDPEKQESFTLKMRIPGWCKTFSLAVNGKTIEHPAAEKGYLSLKRSWKAGDRVTLDLAMPAELVQADPLVKQDLGKRALQRGPVVYCLEQADNQDLDFSSVVLGPASQFTPQNASGKLNGLEMLETSSNGQHLTFIPYFSWDNREPGKMKVWVDYRK